MKEQKEARVVEINYLHDGGPFVAKLIMVREQS